MPKQITIAGFSIRATTTPAVTRLLRQKLRHRQAATVLFANANFILQCKHLRGQIAAAPGIVILNDGIAMDAAARLCTGRRFPENMNGTDFTPAALSALGKGCRVFLFGARPEVVSEAGDAITRLYEVDICGAEDGFSVWDDEAALVERINAARPDVLLVGLGNPLQEEWILRHRTALEVPVVLGIGAFLDFVSGNVPRAPMILRRLHLEWAYRLANEPRRLAYRYSIGIIRFFSMALFDRQVR
jgi:beta-1,4-glucosyltransferase